jgi:hypothetical protein
MQLDFLSFESFRWFGGLTCDFWAEIAKRIFRATTNRFELTIYDPARREKHIPFMNDSQKATAAVRTTATADPYGMTTKAATLKQA